MRNNRKRETKQTVAIVGEGLTEHLYFNQIRKAERKISFNISPELPSHSGLKQIFAKSFLRIDDGYDVVIALIDMDVLSRDPLKLQKYKKFKKDAKNKARMKGVEFITIESSPCTEYWFLMHFIFDNIRNYSDYKSVEKELKKHITGYEKKENFLTRIGGGIYNHLRSTGNIKEACNAGVKLLEKRNSPDYSDINYSEIFKVFTLLNIPL